MEKKEKEEEEEREDDTKTSKNRNCRKTAFFLNKKMLRYRDNIVMVKLYRPEKVTLPNGKMEI